jgi:hypothetical protein
MTSCKGNVVELVLQKIVNCSEMQKILQSMPANAEAEQIRERAVDMLRDIEQQLCDLAATFITAPMSGRIFTPLPHEFATEQRLVQSLQDQMQ